MLVGIHIFIVSKLGWNEYLQSPIFWISGREVELVNDNSLFYVGLWAGILGRWSELV